MAFKSQFWKLASTRFPSASMLEFPPAAAAASRCRLTPFTSMQLKHNLFGLETVWIPTGEGVYISSVVSLATFFMHAGVSTTGIRQRSTSPFGGLAAFAPKVKIS